MNADLQEARKLLLEAGLTEADADDLLYAADKQIDDYINTWADNVRKEHAKTSKQGMPIGTDTNHPRKPKQPGDREDAPSANGTLLEKHNDHHDEHGRFATGDSGTAITVPHAQRMVEDAGGKWNGVQTDGRGRKWATLTEPKSGSTGIVLMDEMSPARVNAKLQEIRIRMGVEKSVVIPDSVIESYKERATKMHGSASQDLGDELPERPDTGVIIGENAELRVWRVVDGWGEYYFADDKKSGSSATFIACKMPDVMAYDIGVQYKRKMPKSVVKELGMGDTAWDKKVLELTGVTPHGADE